VRQWLPVCVAFLLAQLALSTVEQGNLFNALLFAVD
jgi:hypothetical protein